MSGQTRRGGRRTGLLFILPSLAGLGAFTVVPFFGCVWYSLTQGVAQPRFVGLRNFSELVRNPSFLLAAKNTGLFLAASVPCLIALSLLVSLLLQGGRNSPAWWALLAPLAVPAASFALGWQTLFGEAGPLNGLLELVGFPRVDFLDARAFPVLLLVYVVKNVGYMTVVFSGAISALPSEYREVFRLDSSSGWQYAWKVVVPLISPMVFFVAVVSVMNSLKIFRESYALYADQPPDSVYMLQNFMNENFHHLNYQRLSTASLIVVAVLAAFIWLFLKLESRVRPE